MIIIMGGVKSPFLFYILEISVIGLNNDRIYNV